MDDISTLRASIDAIDSKLVALLVERIDLSKRIGSIKARLDVPVDSAENEQSKIDKLVQIGEAGLVSPEFIQNVFEEILYESRRVQSDK